jgi:hypothetical protein
LTEWRNRKRAAAQAQAQPSTAPAAAAPTAEDIGIDNMTYLEPRDENWREARRVTEGLIVQMRDEVKQHNAKFFLVTSSNAIQVYPNAVVRRNFLRRIGTNTLFYPNLRLKALAEREHFDFMDLARPMQAYAEQNKVFLHGFGSDVGGNSHWNADGHSLAAELIAQRLCSSTAAR